MPEFRKFKEFILQREKETEFDVATGDFGNLVIRPAEGFHYFYDTAERRLIKSFVLRDLIAGSVPVRGVSIHLRRHDPHTAPPHRAVEPHLDLPGALLRGQLAEHLLNPRSGWLVVQPHVVGVARPQKLVRE